MKKSIISVAVLCAASLIFTGCGGKSPAPETTAQSAPETTAQTAPETAAQSAPVSESGTVSEKKESAAEKADSETKAIAVYFSRVGNTEFPENVDAVSSASLQADGSAVKGNAQLIAEWIAGEAGCETFEIVSEEFYPADYDQTVEQAKNEQNENLRPALKTALDDPEQYDVIYLAFPNWWGDLPMPVYSFFDTYDFSGKTIKVFITHEGSHFSNTIDTIRNLEPDAEIVEGLDIRGESVKDEEQNIRTWVQENK